MLRALVQHVGVLAVVNVVDADVDGAAAFLEFPVEIGAEVEPVVVGHPEVVAFNGGNIGIVVNPRIQLGAQSVGY